MVTAVDTSVLLDVACNDPAHADASERALRQAAAVGMLVVCECVIAEVMPVLGRKRFMEFMADWQLRFIPSSEESALHAGEIYAQYLARGGKVRAIVPDFMIGAHAAAHADRLLARDRGFLRDYFRALNVINPARERSDVRTDS